ncbi:MAG TPA: RHS domain-containing protein [Salinisphaera sp.]|nr:RHS domain-containing protein [Salinisphaera sp.]HET7315336.1 RHS domain-containing protein [Salinisphaera sp.]
MPIVTAIDGAGCASCGAADVRYRYNDRLELTAKIRASGVAMRYTYDGQGRLAAIHRTAPGAKPRLVARYHYADDTNRPSAIDRPSVNPNGVHRLSVAYTDLGHVRRVTESGYAPQPDGGYRPIARTTRLTWQRNELTAIDGPRTEVADIVHLAYDRDHRLQQITGPTGLTWRVTGHDAYGRPTVFQTDDQAPIHLRYNRAGQPTRVQRGGQVITYRYTAAGRIRAITDPAGQTRTLDYDDAGRLTAVGDARGNRLTARRNAAGQLRGATLTDAGGAVLRTIAFVQDADRRFNARPERGPDHGARAPPATRTNAFGQLLRITAPGQLPTQFHYDARHRLTGIIDARGGATTDHIDDFGRTIWRDSADTGRTQYRYDAADHKTWQRDANGAVITRAFNAAGQLIEKTTPAGVTRFTYAHGRLIEAATPATTEQFNYDNQGRLTAQTRIIDDHTWTTRYRYDPQTGQVAAKTLPDGQTLRYHYDKHTGHLRAITRADWWGLAQTTIVGELTYRPFGGLTHWTHGNGETTTLQRNAAGQITAISHGHGPKLVYRYNAQGRITGVKTDTAAWRYGYDAQGRLTAAATQKTTYRYRYDALGNRTGRSVEGHDAVYRYAQDSNRLQAVQHGDQSQSTDYHYDAAGNPIAIGNRHFTYNTEHRPVTLTINGQLKARWTYNAFGERVKQTRYHDGHKQVRYYLYDGHHRTATANAAGEITTQTVYVGNRPMAQLNGRTIYALHTDALNAPVAATDAQGRTVWAASYAPFGRARVTVQKIHVHLRRPGQYADGIPGLYYNYYCDYNTRTGRYLTPSSGVPGTVYLSFILIDDSTCKCKTTIEP